MQALKKGDRDGYLGQEKLIREGAGLPPYGQAGGDHHFWCRCA